MKIDLKLMRKKGFNSVCLKDNKKKIEIINSKKKFSKISSCPICKSKKRQKILVKFGIEIFKCLNCDVDYSSKKPNDFSDLYSTEHLKNHYLNVYDRSRKYKMNRFGKERISILKKYKKKGNLLDFGCGTGWFLEIAKKNYNSYGIEFSDQLREFLFKKYEIKTFKNLSKLPKSLKFDIITAFDVIEHVENPAIFLSNLRKFLKKDGIALIYTPNKDSLGFSYLKFFNNLLCPPAHLFYFSEKSFRYLLKKTNFKFVSHQTRGLDFGDIYAYLNEDRNTKLANLILKSSNQLQKIFDELKFSNHSRYIIKK